MIEAAVTERGYVLVVQSAAGLPQRFLDAMGRGLARGLLLAVACAQREFMSGPRPGKLDVLTTRLRNSMSSSVEVTDKTVTGKFGNNVRYASFHEHGFHGTINVKAFTRVIDQVTGLGISTDGRRSIRDRLHNLVGFKESRKRAAGRQTTGAVSVQFVKAHTRQVNYAGKPFAHPALVKMMPVVLKQVTDELRQEVARG